MFTNDEIASGIRTEAPRSPRTKRKKWNKSLEGPDSLQHGNHSFKPNLPPSDLPPSDATTHLKNGTL